MRREVSSRALKVTPKPGGGTEGRCCRGNTGEGKNITAEGRHMGVGGGDGDKSETERTGARPAVMPDEPGGGAPQGGGVTLPDRHQKAFKEFLSPLRVDVIWWLRALMRASRKGRTPRVCGRRGELEV